MISTLVDKNGNELRVSKGRALEGFKRIPDFATLVNEGKVFSFLETTTTVALVARPTTTAGVTMQNPATSGKYYVIFEVIAYTDVVPATLCTVSAGCSVGSRTARSSTDTAPKSALRLCPSPGGAAACSRWTATSSPPCASSTAT